MKTLYAFLVALFLTSSVSAQIIDIPDANFKAALIAEGVDTNSDGEIQVSEAEAQTGLRVNDQSISSLVGIEYFTNLDFLFCHDNQLTSLDVSEITTPLSLYCQNNLLTSLNFGSNIRSIACNNNLLTSLDLSSAINLQGLDCGNNQLTTLDLSNQTEAFTALDCYGNSLTTLDIEHLIMLSWLTCDGNQLTSLNLGSNPSIWLLSASLNQLTDIDTSNLTDLVHLGVNDNFLTHLDISNNSTIRRLYCDNNQLVSLNLKNGTLNYNEFAPDDDYELDFENNPDLEFICADYSGFGISPGEEIDIVQDLIDTYGYTNCYVSSYCSFVPGGTFYTVEGTTVLDLDVDGCDSGDNVFGHLNFNIAGGSAAGNFIANSSGNYTIPVQAGTHIITPVLENPGYFTVSPTEITVSFPTDTSPFLQDFCITPNGVFNDLEITIIPLEVARPGFDTNYRVVYKNKGNTILTGNINFAFEDDVTTFVSSTPPNESGVPDLLQYSFTDLLPFESREINLTMNLNAPTDTPPLNAGDILTFNTSIEFVGTDETPDDNMFELNQIVVNSFDPNDKTCLEGEFITPEMVGDYVHYMIRFENTGSADAVNIVVKDVIDITKYDLSTFVPLNASHDFYARITNNIVEFIFEDINLPFDDANNDGYVVFKIKTLDTLVLNDTFENEAEIYFDFNFPIITNTAGTTVQVLSVDDFEFDANISIYPNPVQNEFFINSKQPIETVSIYDISGRLVQQTHITGNQTNISIATKNLKASAYFVSVETSQNAFTTKLVKK